MIKVSRDARMLVVGNRGSGGFREMVLGSVSDQCVRYAHCRVLVTRGWIGNPADLPHAPDGASRSKAGRISEQTHGTDWFEMLADGTRAAHVGEPGRLEIQLQTNLAGTEEVIRTDVVTDVTLAVYRPVAGSGHRSAPDWEIRLLTGSRVSWPMTGNGLGLGPQLLPNLKPPTVEM